MLLREVSTRAPQENFLVFSLETASIPPQKYWPENTALEKVLGVAGSLLQYRFL